MTILDWLIVVVLNGSIIAYGIYLSRGVKKSSDWFLAGRSLPWWLVGLSMYATAIDSSDLIADAGGTYTLGFSYYVVNWVGVIGGWALAAFFIAPPMYRAGMYTNAEYLEARFGAGSRVISAFVQVQYRTSVIAIMSNTVFLTLTVLCDWGPTAAWAGVGVLAVVAAIYTAMGGLKSVAITDGLQVIIMSVAAIVFFFVVWGEVGGWSGLESKLAEQDATKLVHVGEDNISVEDVSQHSHELIQNKLLLGGEYDETAGTITTRTPAWLIALAFVALGVAYSVVNHTQSMRLFASKSLWDLKMCVWVAGVFMLVMSFFNLTMGVMGRALYPDPSEFQLAAELQKQDSIYPYLVKVFGAAGLTGLIVSGILAATLSTYDSIGSTLSSLLTRDVYARLIKRDGTDDHYLRVGRWLTPVVIGGSFFYIPFMQEGMLLFFIEISSAFVMPLLTLYIMGRFTRVHRSSGLIGLLVGTAYGGLRLFAVPIAEKYGVVVLPGVLANSYAAYIFSMVITAAAMVAVSLIRGWEKSGELLHDEQDGWLRSSQLEVREIQEGQAGEARPAFQWQLAAALAIAVVGIGCLLSFVIFW